MNLNHTFDNVIKNPLNKQNNIYSNNINYNLLGNTINSNLISTKNLFLSKNQSISPYNNNFLKKKSIKKKQYIFSKR